MPVEFFHVCRVFSEIKCPSRFFMSVAFFSEIKCSKNLVNPKQMSLKLDSTKQFFMLSSLSRLSSVSRFKDPAKKNHAITQNIGIIGHPARAFTY